MRSIEGEAAVGRRLSVRLQLGRGRPMTIRPTICTLREYEELAWRGRIFLPGLLDGEHRFMVEHSVERACRFVHSERFSGILVTLLWGVMGKKTSEGFVRFNEALKKRVEGAG